MTSAALRTSPRALLATLLDQPDLAERVQALPPRALRAVVERVGLEDAGELVALATTEQLLHVLDDDLWSSDEPGRDETFDAARLVTWLEVLLEAGDRVVADRLAALPEDLVTLAFHRQLMVLETAALGAAIREDEDGELVDKALSNHLHEELDDYILVARGADGWDAVLAALLALDRDHHDLVARILDRCAHLTEDEVEELGGLHAALGAEQSLEEDVAAEREERRAADGYVAPSSARAFLALARQPPAELRLERDAVTRAWFRELARPTSAKTAAAPPASPGRADRLLAALQAPGGTETPPALRLLSGGATAPRPLLFTAAMQAIHAREARTFAARSEELAYLANVLAAGCGHRGRRMRPVEAVQAALATCSLGLDLVGGEPADALVAHPADRLFRIAWHRLSTDVVARAAALVARGDELDDARGEALRALADDCPSRAGALAGPRTFLASRADLDAALGFLDALLRPAARPVAPAARAKAPAAQRRPPPRRA